MSLFKPTIVNPTSTPNAKMVRGAGEAGNSDPSTVTTIVTSTTCTGTRSRDTLNIPAPTHLSWTSLSKDTVTGPASTLLSWSPISLVSSKHEPTWTPSGPEWVVRSSTHTGPMQTKV